MEQTEQVQEQNLNLDQTESLTDLYDHCRECGAPATWYGLCDSCNEWAKGR